ncbi:MAG: hypothetical protein HYS27_25500 [Deltaproteobacteria bacterium]|nr:hypothetical protein [Deltaproteobacteria bacterium]
MAVRADGRRIATAPCFDDAELRLPGGADDPVALDHAGPRAATWSLERAVAAADLPEPETGRRPRALLEAGWAALTERFAAAAARVRRADRTPVLAVDDDGLLQAALSPRTGGADDRARLARLLAVHRACGPVDVALCVEELCPGGLDATDGIEAARALAAQGAGTIYASGGTRAFGPLFHRTKGGSEGDPALALASAAWLVGRVSARVVAVVWRGEPGALLPPARALGLGGVVARGAS